MTQLTRLPIPKRRLASFLTAALTLSSCLSTSGTSDSASATTIAAPFVQTWRKPYRTTTCGAWLHRMTPRERFVAAHDFLDALKAYDQTDGAARRFARNISTDCRPVASLRVAEVAGALATLDTADFPR